MLAFEGIDYMTIAQWVGHKDGGTPLDQAINFKKTETADLLRKHGAKTGAELRAAGN